MERPIRDSEQHLRRDQSSDNTPASYTRSHRRSVHIPDRASPTDSNRDELEPEPEAEPSPRSPPVKWEDNGSGASPSASTSAKGVPGGPSTSGKTNQAAFVKKLFTMVQDPAEMDESTATAGPPLICWSRNGDTFSVCDPISFSRAILPLYFKHNNWQSFVRQLNMYGFHKVNDVLSNSSTAATSPDSVQAWEFQHPCFRRNRQDLLVGIKRKSTKQGHAMPGGRSESSTRYPPAPPPSAPPSSSALNSIQASPRASRQGDQRAQGDSPAMSYTSSARTGRSSEDRQAGHPTHPAMTNGSPHIPPYSRHDSPQPPSPHRLGVPPQGAGMVTGRPVSQDSNDSLVVHSRGRAGTMGDGGDRGGSAGLPHGYAMPPQRYSPRSRESPALGGGAEGPQLEKMQRELNMLGDMLYRTRQETLAGKQETCVVLKAILNLLAGIVEAPEERQLDKVKQGVAAARFALSKMDAQELDPLDPTLPPSLPSTSSPLPKYGGYPYPPPGTQEHRPPTERPLSANSREYSAQRPPRGWYQRPSPPYRPATAVHTPPTEWGGAKADPAWAPHDSHPMERRRSWNEGPAAAAAPPMAEQQRPGTGKGTQLPSVSMLLNGVHGRRPMEEEAQMSGGSQFVGVRGRPASEEERRDGKRMRYH